MKRIAIAAITFLSFYGANAQLYKRSKVETGLIVGANVSTVTMGSEMQSVKPGATVGGFVEFPLTFYRKASVSLGLQYDMQGYKGKKYKQYDFEKFEELDFEKLEDVTTHYVYLPVKLNFYTRSGIGFSIGGQIGYLMGASGQFDINYANPARKYLNMADNSLDKYLFEQGYRSNKYLDYYAPLDFGVNAGLSFDVGDNMFIAINAYYGLQDIYKKDNNYQKIELPSADSMSIGEYELQKARINKINEYLNFDPVRNLSVKATFGYRL